MKIKNIIDAIHDPLLFQPWFKKRGSSGKSWVNWEIFLAALFALPMTPEQLTVYTQCTGRTVPPTTPFSEAFLCIGRRGGKSFTLALIAVWLSCFHENRQYLASGERGTVVIIAADRKQARVIFRFVKGLLTKVPMLARMIERETADSFDLNNSITIEIQTASFRSTRGYTLLAALCDEIAYWRSDELSANPDKEILAALKPAMATIPNAKLLCASSPYARRGVLWEASRKHFGKDDSPTLFWKAATRTMNPSVPQVFIDDAYEADPACAAAEYGAEFRTDVESFVSREVVDAAVIIGRYELPRIDGVAYVARIDPSGGSSDSMTLAICHMEGERAILDCVRERRPPFSPDDVAKEFADVIKSYGIASASSDRYGGMWPRERMAVHGVDVTNASLTTSDTYLALLPILNSKRTEWLDHPRLINQTCSLERHTGRGKDIIDHPPGQHDDVICAVAGCIVEASQRQAQAVPIVAPIIIGGRYDTPIPDHALQPGQSPEAFAAKERAKLPSIPRAPAAPGTNTTTAYYDWVDSGGGGGPPGGWTPKERF